MQAPSQTEVMLSCKDYGQLSLSKRAYRGVFDKFDGEDDGVAGDVGTVFLRNCECF